MEAKEIILRSLNESWGYLADALEGLTKEEIAWAPIAECNSIAFILWHVIRAEDFWVNRVIQHTSDVYEAHGWRERLGTPADETGARYTKEQLQAWPIPKLENLRGYAQAVREKTLALLDSITHQKLLELPQPERPTETTGMLLAHLITEIAMHVGQIDYLRGVHRVLDSPHIGHWR